MGAKKLSYSRAVSIGLKRIQIFEGGLQKVKETNHFSQEKASAEIRREFFRTKSWVNFAGDFLVDLFGPFSLEKSGGKKPPQNPQQNSNQNLGVSRPKPTLQGSGLEFFINLFQPCRRPPETTFFSIFFGGSQEGGFQKGGLGGCSAGTKPGTRVRSPKSPFYETALLSPSEPFWCLQKGGFQKGGFGGCSPGTITGTRVRSPKPPFYETALLSPSEYWRVSDPKALMTSVRGPDNCDNRLSCLAHQNRTIAIASDLRVDGAKSPEIPQQEGVLGLKNRSPKSQIASDFPSHP